MNSLEFFSSLCPSSVTSSQDYLYVLVPSLLTLLNQYVIGFNDLYLSVKY